MSNKIDFREILLEEDSDMELLDLICDFEIHRERLGQHRWQTHVHSICEYNGKFYKVDWMKAATECQDDYFPDGDLIEEVVPVTKMVEITVWEPIGNE